MNKRTVLISGAGIAGPTLAYWLARHGFRPTVVERSAAIRSSGSPVDVRGRAVGVVEQMGVLPQLLEARTHVTGIRFVNAAGRRVGGVNLQALQRASAARDIELPRGDLASILYQASRDSAEFLFHDSIVGLEQDEEGVNVTFEHAPPRRFELVIGADGLHSAVRRLAFGPESDFVRHMGLYVATLPLPEDFERGRDVLMYNAPGRSASVHPGCGKPLAAFIYWSPAVPGFDHRDTAQHQRLLAAAYAGDAWRVPELLGLVRASADLYFDSVSKVSLAQWSRGRVALLGDAASCVSLFGDGSTLAIEGAYVLAEALAASPGDHRLAFQRYEAEHRKRVEPKQRNVALVGSLLVPTTRWGIATRNLASQLWPAAAAASWLGRGLAPRRQAA